uniref:DNA-directed DNA polymerase n=1 Tax=Tanacetum cinerariifolium TaxID=118510 RepID=A0A6L2LM41_TANCI|nr:DNA-directed DNA polymerase [Tanacetum cinerariifolium]
MNTASSLGTGSLPSNTIPNPQEELKLSPLEVVLTESTNNVPPLVVQPSPASTSFSTISSSKMPEVTKDTVQPSTENIQPPVLSLPELTSTQMILELADRSTARPTGIAEDVFVKVGKFHFPTDFVVVDYVVDPRVPLILGRSFLKTGRALIDVYSEELTFRVDDEAITFKVGQTSKYSYNDDASINRVNVIDLACEEYVKEGDDFILEEIEACLTSELIPLRIDDTDLELEGDIRLLEELLNNDPSLSHLPPKELNVEEIKTVKSFIDEPSELEFKDLPSHLEYAYLEGTDKLPVIIVKGLKDDEKEALLKVLKSHKRAITWKISDIKGIDPRFCTNKILMVDDFKPTVQSQRRVNLKIHEVKENQEKDKIGSKPDTNGKRGEARKCLKQLHLKRKKNQRKQKKNGRKRIHGSKVIKLLKKEEKKRAKNAIPPKFKSRGQNCQVPHRCDARTSHVIIHITVRD